VCGFGFRVYRETSESGQLYGVVGAAMLLLTWLDVCALALLLILVAVRT